MFDNYSKLLPNGFELRGLSQEQFKPLWLAAYPVVFTERPRLSIPDLLSEHERAKLQELATFVGSPLCFRFGLFKEDRFVGWHIGNQKSSEEFYMRNSGVLPEYQGQGLYTAILKPILGLLTDVGFQIISSKHTATNNRVIVPKLKAGFVITGLEISDLFGTLVRLEYFTNPIRREVIDYRCGQSLPSPNLRPLLGL